MLREASWPCASSVTVSRRPLSQSEETRFGPEGITSTQPAVSISSSTVFFARIKHPEGGRRRHVGGVHEMAVGSCSRR